MNLFPSTLSTNYYYKDLNTIDNNYIASLIEWVLIQPSNIELRDVTIYPSERENSKKTLL
jgi:NADP-dependent 3-hydroxy acid dehydrogenase YdfG